MIGNARSNSEAGVFGLQKMYWLFTGNLGSILLLIESFGFRITTSIPKHVLHEALFY